VWSLSRARLFPVSNFVVWDRHEILEALGAGSAHKGSLTCRQNAHGFKFREHRQFFSLGNSSHQDSASACQHISTALG